MFFQLMYIVTLIPVIVECILKKVSAMSASLTNTLFYTPDRVIMLQKVCQSY